MDAGSTRPKMPGVTEIFAEYVRLRQNGRGQQEAVDHLKPMLERLRKEARQQLAALLRSWEAREGHKYQNGQKKPPDVRARDLTAPPRADEDLSWLPDSGQASRPLNVNTPVHPAVGNAPPTQPVPPQRPPARTPPNAPQRIPADEQTFYCPSCGKPNRLGDAYCYACGALLNVTGGQTRNLESTDSDLIQVGEARFGHSSTLLLHVQGYERPIYVKVQDRPEVLLGRASMQTGTLPDVDLTPYGAAEKGVSRTHARLRYQDNSITLTDLDSVNNTYINGQRLHPNEVRVLRDGDEIRLGRLQMRVSFMHAVSRLK